MVVVLSSIGSPPHTNTILGGIMPSIFLEGLQSAREILKNKGLAALDDLINELENNEVETAAVQIKAETR